MDYNPQNPNDPTANRGVTAPVMSVKDWMLTLLLLAIPLVNLIMLFVWAFGGGNNPSKSNYAKASLLWAAIIIVLYIVLAVVFGAAFLANIGSMSNTGY